MSEQNAIVEYKGKQINLFSDERNDYVSLTDIYKAAGKYGKSINAWLKTRQTLDFLDAWEKKYNPKYAATHLSQVIKLARERNGLSVQAWIDLTNAKGVFSRIGSYPGTYAHKDIAIRFAAWLNPEFELFLSDELNRLREIERKKISLDYLDFDQIRYLTLVIEVFKFVAHQVSVVEAHKDVFASKSSAQNPFAEFNVFRNEVLGIDKETIDKRIIEYCKEKRIALTKNIQKKTQGEKILMMDSYESVRNAVWSFLSIKGEVNALKMAKLAEDLVRIQQGQILRENETDLFHTKKDLAEFSNFLEDVNKMKEVKTARDVLAYRKEVKKRPIPMYETDITAENHFDVPTDFNKTLLAFSQVPKPPKNDKPKKE